MLDSFSLCAILNLYLRPLHMNLRSQPHQIVKLNGTTFTLLGTVHVSADSAETVKSELRSGKYDAVAIELCEKRAKVYSGKEPREKFSWWRSFRKHGYRSTLLRNALAHLYRAFEVGHGLDAGGEFKAAMQVSDARDIPCILIDQDAEITAQRASVNVGVVSATFTYVVYRFASWLIKHLPTEDLMEKLEELKHNPKMYSNRNSLNHKAIIEERDAYMVNELRKLTGYKNVLVVIGAGHLEGMTKLLKESA